MEQYMNHYNGVNTKRTNSSINLKIIRFWLQDRMVVSGARTFHQLMLRY